MNDWLSLVYVGPQQLLPVAVGVVLWVALAGLGSLVTPRGRIHEANAFYGWAVVSTVFTLVGVVVADPFFGLSILAALGAVAGLALAAWRREPVFVPGAWRVLLLALPILLIAGAMDPSQWDEFSHWLPAPKYLMLFDGFPTAARPDAGPQMLSAYPYGWPFLIYLAARIGGGFIDNVGGILNVLMLLTFASFALRTAFAVAGRPRGQTIGWPLAAGIVLTATLFNPTLVQKIVFTSYSDVASSVVTGVAVLVAYRLPVRMGAREKGSVAAAGWQLALVLALLANIRQPNVVVVAAILAGLALVAWRDPDSRLAHLLRLGAVVVLPALVVYAAWRWYVAAELAGIPGAEATLRPLAAWNVSAIPGILWAMGVVAVKKLGFFAPMAIACVFAARALVAVRSDFDRLAILTATVFVLYNAFLLFTYVAHFALHDALSAISYWRYNIDVGSIAIIFLTAGALTLWSRHDSFDRYPRWAAPVAVLLVTLLPIALAGKIRFDLEPPKPHFTAVAKDMAALDLAGEHYVLDPTGTGESAVITRVYLGSRGHAWLASFHGPTPKTVAEYAGKVAPGNYLLVHSVVPGVAESVGRALDPRRSYLLKRETSGWTIVKEWPKPANHPW